MIFLFVVLFCFCFLNFSFTIGTEIIIRRIDIVKYINLLTYSFIKLKKFEFEK